MTDWDLTVQIVSSALECAPQSLSEESGRLMHPDWDSLGHVQVVLGLERHLQRRLTDHEVERAQNMRGVLALIESHTKEEGQKNE